MPVSNPGTPSLAGNYANIQAALEQSAQIAGKDTGTMGAVAAAAAPVATRAVKMQDTADEKGLIAFKGAIEDQLNKNSATYQAQGAGKTFYTQDDVNTQMDQQYGDVDPKYRPNVGKGIWATPTELQALAEHGERRANVERAVALQPDPVKKAAIRLFGEDPKNAPQLALLMGAVKLQKATDEYGRTYFYNPADPTQRMFAPPPQPINDESQITPKLAAPITKEQQGLSENLKPINSQLNQIAEAEKIIQNPESKGIEQGAALLRYARAAAGSVRNWKEVATVSGNPDIKDTFERLISSKTDGSTLSEGDKQSLLNVLAYDKQAANTLSNSLKENAVSRATANSPLVDSGIVRKRVLAGTENIGGGDKTRTKVAVTGPNGETGMAYSDQKLPAGWKFK